jgi:hypothetical protein
MIKTGSIHLTLILIVLLLAAMFTGCKKDLAELNTNPNEPSTTDPNYLFRYALQQGAGNYNSDVTLEQWGLMNWTMFMAARGGIEPGKEYIIPSGKDDFWREQYTNALSNTQVIIEMAAGDPDMVNMRAAAMIWKINLSHKLTDLWGDIPYSDALKGISDLNYAPFYDRQDAIYKSMLEELKNAVESFDGSKMFFDPEVDLVFQGDINKWIAFGNSLRLRLATRINRIDHSKYEDVVNNLVGQPLISENHESALFPFNSVVKNHLYETMFRGESVVQNNPSKFMVDLLVNTEDPRLPVLCEKAPLSFLPIFPEYNGVPNLIPNNDPIWNTYNPDGDWGDISRIGSWFLRNETPGVIMSYAEVCFLKAEAALNGLWPGSSEDYVKQGVRANMGFYGEYGDEDHVIPEEKIEAYLADLPETTLELIITQKWISFIFENGYEAYAEYRRTGFPILTDYDGQPINEDIFPVRMIYPYSEFTLNRDNYNDAINHQGADNEFTRVWWDDE